MLSVAQATATWQLQHHRQCQDPKTRLRISTAPSSTTPSPFILNPKPPNALHTFSPTISRCSPILAVFEPACRPPLYLRRFVSRVAQYLTCFMSVPFRDHPSSYHVVYHHQSEHSHGWPKTIRRAVTIGSRVASWTRPKKGSTCKFDRERHTGWGSLEFLLREKAPSRQVQTSF